MSFFSLYIYIYFIFLLLFFFFWLCYAACGILVPPPGIEPSALSSERAKSQPLDLQGIPFLYFKHFIQVQHVLCCHFSYVLLFATLWTVAHQAPLSMGFYRQEYWSGLPCPPLGDLPDPRIESASLQTPALAGRLFTTSATSSTRYILKNG